MRRSLLCRAFYALGVAGAAVLLTGAGDTTMVLTGAGASLPAGLYARWFGEFGKGHAGVRFDYQSVGSGAGLEQIAQRAVDFAGSDVPMTAEQLENSPAVVHVPTALAAVAVVYNLNSAPPGGLRLGRTVLADIFLGRIAQWNDPRIQAQNPGVRLPELAIGIVYRTDLSGTTRVFTDYLAKVSPEWRQKVGSSMSVPWPLGVGIKGSKFALNLIKTTHGSLGYADVVAAQRGGVAIAAVGNAAGNYVLPTAATTAAAASQAGTGSLRSLLTHMPGAETYPMVSFSYLLVHPDQADLQRGKTLLRFLWWVVHEGQQYTTPLGFVPLPRSVVERVEPVLQGLKVQGRLVSLAD